MTRIHKIKSTFFNKNFETKTYEVLITKNVTELIYDGSFEPVAVFLNDGDWSYAKSILDS